MTTPSSIQPIQLATDLSGMNAVITGGTSGIGLATAQYFHAAGASVVVTGNNPATMQQARESLPSEVTVTRADVRSIGDAERLAHDVQTQMKSLQVLFLNAGIAQLAPFEAVTEASYADHMDINVKGVIFPLQKLLPLMSAGGSIIVNTSIADQKGTAMLSIYSATKGAVAALVRTLAVELASRGIRVNSIAPAMIRTPIQAKFGLPAEVQAQVERDYTSRIPLGRFGEPHEVASVALFLASRASSYITGAEIPVDGGLLVA